MRTQEGRSRCWAASGAVVLAIAWAGSLPAAGAEPAKGQWASISDGVLAKLQEQGVKPAWPGQTTGVAVDRTTGHLFMIVTGLGVWRSSDKGATFERLDGGAIGGRCETGYALQMDPGGQRLACFMLDGRSGLTLDGGKAWAPVKNVNRGYDWAAVHWTPEGPGTIFALVHESGGIGAVSQDGGKSWKQIGKQYFAVGVFGPQTLVCSKERQKGILRSTDGGQTWEPVSDAAPIGAMTLFQGAGYWLSDQGLLKTSDQGKAWERVGTLTDGVWGPYFGKDSSHFVVVNREGFQETADGGKTWRLIAAYPPSVKGEFNPRGWFLNFAWDPIGKVCYVARMGQPTCKCEY
jgi:hypothetical protein